MVASFVHVEGAPTSSDVDGFTIYVLLTHLTIYVFIKLIG